jgi:catechol 2,3-dioxygenase-like lactoylglutathione lyase family enzyme
MYPSRSNFYWCSYLVSVPKYRDLKLETLRLKTTSSDSELRTERLRTFTRPLLARLLLYLSQYLHCFRESTPGMSTSAAIATLGLRHLALNVADVATSVEFYTSLFGMQVVWQPDPENAYLSSGCDNLALHKVTTPAVKDGQRLDHLGFLVRTPEDVDHAAAVLTARNVRLRQAPRTHRDGSRSLYCFDPDGNVIQVLYEPTLSTQHIG